MVDEQKVFYSNMCFVCHLTVKDIQLKHCSSCKLVSYCCESHQRKHWKGHREFCRVIQNVEKSLPLVNVNDNENWYKYRTNLMMLSEIKLGRKLKHYEMNMILFPNNCQICHRRTDLQPCWSCLCVSYCSDDHRSIDFSCHSSICQLLLLCFKIDLYQEKKAVYPNFSLRQGDTNLLDISFFIASNIVVLKRNPVSKDIEEALVSELLTCPLSLLYALSRVNYSFGSSTVIHVVGSSMLEMALLKSWEIILHVQSHVTNLIIYFIGPDAKELIDRTSFCEGKLTFKFSDQLYHDFVKSDVYLKPHLICAFNCGFHEFEGMQTDTWKRSLPLLIKNENVPFVFTSFTKSEADQDLKQLLQIDSKLNVKVDLNPFSSLRPYRDLENLGVYFNNKYVCSVLND